MNRDALVVGIGNYQYFKSMDAPTQDAEAIAQRLECDGEFRVRRLPEAIAAASSAGATLEPVVGKAKVSRSQLESALENLFTPDGEQAPDTALFYFSGHGLPDRKGYDKGYLATSETNPDAPRSGLSLQWLHWLLSESPVKRQIVWLDCCHSGALLVNVAAANPGNGERRDRCFIASSRDFESSWQDLNSPYSVLTKALLDGLDPGRLPGSRVNSYSLLEYVDRALAGELQKPICTNFGDAIELTRAFQTPPEPTASEALGDCPYKGLEYFDCNDRDPQFFFGREALTDQLLDRVRTSNFLALVGASGSGKSSVLRAGLLHQLQLGRRIAGSDRWQILVMRPDATPLKNLADVFVAPEGSQVARAAKLGEAEKLLAEGADGLARLVRMSEADRVVLAIDQFEEVFTRCGDLDARQRFFECVLGAIEREPERLCAIVAMRSDFVGKCLEQEYGGLARRVERDLVSVLPMTTEELKAAICKPAERVGAIVEDLLVDAILRDIQAAPGRLPLLQYALTQLWDGSGRLTLNGYQSLGGIEGALQKRATALYESFEEAERATCRHIFLALTQLGEGTEDTRRRVVQRDLVTALHPEARVAAVLGRLTAPENRLLVTSVVERKGASGDRLAIVDVAHEALIRYWPLLRGWIEANRDLLRQQRRIEAAAVEWRDAGEKPGYLLEGLRLDEARVFEREQGRVFPLSGSAVGFIRRSVWGRWRRRVKAASWLLIPVALIGGVIEYQVREEGVKADYARLAGNGFGETEAVRDLVKGCGKKQWKYLGERLFGNCRSLTGASLQKANLNGLDLKNVDLKDANLSGASLRGASLRNADLRNADLSESDLRNADLRNADLGGNIGSLSGANLEGADLRNSSLDESNLRYVNLEGVNLKEASLRKRLKRYSGKLKSHSSGTQA